MAQILKEEIVYIVGGKAGKSEKPHVGQYAMLDYKTENGNTSMLYMPHTTPEVQAVVKSLDTPDSMGKKIKITTSIDFVKED